MHSLGLLAIASLSAVSSAANSFIWVSSVPSYVRPYAIPHYGAQGYVVGAQIYRFPVTGPSSDNAFTLISTAAPGSAYLGVLPHTHQAHYENFFNYKGRFQLWTEKDGDEEARVLTVGDYGAVPHNTTHTFQILDADTEMVGVIQPGGFEDLFYTLASANYSSATYSPYDPSIADTNSSPPASVISSLEAFDVYGQLEFNPRRDLVNGTAPSNSTWRTGSNSLATDAETPFFVAKDHGPKYLSSSQGYQVIQPLVTPVQSDGNFTLSTINMDSLLSNYTAETRNFEGHAAFEVLEGQLMVKMLGETVSLLQGDVVFIPGNTTYSYWSKIAFTKVLYISQGAKGLDSTLIDGAESWDSPVWPTNA